LIRSEVKAKNQIVVAAHKKIEAKHDISHKEKIL